jgi:glycosyltransferase involved in cell wall biosynthesis
MPTIGVVMATFNGEEWIEAQLRSISSQTRLPERLVISDDGSTDGTVEIAQKFARNAPFEVELLEGPRTGCYENFWLAAKHSDTDVIAWCDQDDAWFPQKLQLCERLMEDNNVPFVSHSAVVADATLAPTGQLYPNYTRTRVLEPLVGDWFWWAPGFTQFFRAELLQSVQWEDRPSIPNVLNGRFAHDEVIALLAFATCQRLEIANTLAIYRQHGRNLSDGAPKVRGPLQKVKVALSIESTAYSHQAWLAELYGHFIAACDPSNSRAIDYFAVIEERCLRRSKIHQSPDRLSGARNLAVTLARGDYGRRSHGGFGKLALSRDLVALALDANRSPT